MLVLRVINWKCLTGVCSRDPEIYGYAINVLASKEISFWCDTRACNVGFIWKREGFHKVSDAIPGALKGTMYLENPSIAWFHRVQKFQATTLLLQLIRWRDALNILCNAMATSRRDSKICYGSDEAARMVMNTLSVDAEVRRESLLCYEGFAFFCGLVHNVRKNIVVVNLDT